MNNYTELSKKIKKRLDLYLGFNSDEIFENTDAKIFGGAVRDSIAELGINDIDIICGTKSCATLHKLLTYKGYVFQSNLLQKDLGELYKNIKVICEPHTFTKGDKIIQLIRPTCTVNLNEEEYMNRVDSLINNVDISCCGVSYDGVKVHENFHRAIIHCLCLLFKVNNGAKMYNTDRAKFRQYKLIDRGWKVFDTKEEENQLIRKIQINNLLKDV